MHDTVIIGSGPAGWTAAIYTARANLSPLVIASSVTAGGELMNTTEVENYPGFPEGVMGPDLMEKMQEQAEKFGTDVLYDDVTSLDLSGPVKRVTVGSGDAFEARTIIFATGSAYRKLELPDEDRLSGHGISWCAACDAFFFRGQNVAVVGGGDSAAEEALFLTKFAEKVTLIHRGAELRASKVMQDRVRANPKIEVLVNTEVCTLEGDAKLTGVGIRHTDCPTGRLPVTGLFIAIGADPRTHLVHDQLVLNTDGTIWVDGRSSRTSLAGVFAAGDVIDPIYRQAVTAAASGTVAALDVEQYLAI